MTKLFGPLNQNSFIVRNLDESIRHWTATLSVGPFFRFPPLVFAAGELHGVPHIPVFKAAIAYSGDLMIELIEPEGPSIFREFLDAGGKGVHHNCVLTEDFEAADADFIRRGGKRLQAQRDSAGSKMSYIEMPGPTPVIIEVAQLRPEPLALFAALREAGRNWDGKTAEIRF